MQWSRQNKLETRFYLLYPYVRKHNDLFYIDINTQMFFTFLYRAVPSLVLPGTLVSYIQYKSYRVRSADRLSNLKQATSEFLSSATSKAHYARPRRPPCSLMHVYCCTWCAAARPTDIPGTFLLGEHGCRFLRAPFLLRVGAGSRERADG